MGIRLGTSALTTRGMKEKEFRKIASWINEVISNPKSISKIRREVKKLCRKFPLPLFDKNENFRWQKTFRENFAPA
jgi:glycine hydroxymethyltransferase